MNANTGQELVRLRRKSLNRRCNTLRDEVQVYFFYLLINFT